MFLAEQSLFPLTSSSKDSLIGEKLVVRRNALRAVDAGALEYRENVFLGGSDSEDGEGLERGPIDS